MLRIRYLDQTQQAELSVDQSSKMWSEIRRVVSEKADSFDNVSPVCLILPWWEFLACRDAVKYILDKYDDDVRLDVDAERLLAKANENQQQFLTPSSKRVSRIDLISTLKKLGFTRGLTKEQARNISKLISLDSAADFSVPGSGKTTEALAFFFLKRHSSTRLLIICPKNAFAAWEEQLAKCVPLTTEKIVRLTGGAERIAESLARSPKMMLVTYQQIANISQIVCEYLAKFESHVFLDESHRIKRGYDGVIGNAVLKMAHLPTGKLILSGTPMPNGIDDLYPQLRFLYPELEFDLGSLKETIKPIFVRTTKAEMKLPPVERVLIPVGMKAAQARLYKLLASEVARQAETGLRTVDRNVLRNLGKSVMRLLQAASNPSLLIGISGISDSLLSQVIGEGDGPKIEYVCQRARQLASKGHKIIVWSVFVRNVELIALRLRDLGADFIHGGVETGSEDEDNSREAKIKRFHEDENARVLVANPAACAEGISLHEICHHALYLDRNYNAAQYLQSEDRIHRLGLSKSTKTRVEIIISPGTVDESVNRRVLAKINAMSRTLDDPSLSVTPINLDMDDEGLDVDDIRDLLIQIQRLSK